jgi:uncharacterized protein (DUF934 family)
MPLIKDGRPAIDPWTALDDGVEPAPGAPVIVSLERWRADRDALIARDGPLGLRLASGQTPAEVAGDLSRFALVALEFPKFSDGRAFSYARLLRERYGFAGEVRAVGEVLHDQLLFMHRCGFDAFEIASEDAVERWLDALGEVSVWYQPTGDGRPVALSLRQRRQAARAANGAANGKARANREGSDRLVPAVARAAGAERRLSGCWAC